MTDDGRFENVVSGRGGPEARGGLRDLERGARARPGGYLRFEIGGNVAQPSDPPLLARAVQATSRCTRQRCEVDTKVYAKRDGPVRAGNAAISYERERVCARVGTCTRTHTRASIFKC